MSDALYIPDENKVRAELRYQQSRTRLVELGNEISASKRASRSAAVAARRTAQVVESETDRALEPVAAFSSVFRPAKRRRLGFLKTGL